MALGKGAEDPLPKSFLKRQIDLVSKHGLKLEYVDGIAYLSQEPKAQELLGSSYGKLLQLLWHSPNQKKEGAASATDQGLLSGLPAAIEHAFNRLIIDWQLYEGLPDVLIKLKSMFETNFSGSQLDAGIEYQMFTTIWQTLSAAETSFANAVTGENAPLRVLTDILRQSSEATIERVLDSANNADRVFCKRLQEREILENDFAKRLLDQDRSFFESEYAKRFVGPSKDLTAWRSVATEQPRNLWEKWQRNAFKVAPLELGGTDLVLRLIFKLGKFGSQPALMNGNQVTFPGQLEFDKLTESDRLAYEKSPSGKGIGLFNEFLWKQVALEQTLGAKEGPWQFEHDEAAAYQAASEFAHRLSTTQKILCVMATFVEETVLAVEEGLQLVRDASKHLQNLHANLHFGDASDQLLDIADVSTIILKMAKLWERLRPKLDSASVVSSTDCFVTMKGVEEQVVIKSSALPTDFSTPFIFAVDLFDLPNYYNLKIQSQWTSDNPIPAIQASQSAYRAQLKGLVIPNRDEVSYGVEEKSASGNDFVNKPIDFHVAFKKVYSTPPVVVCWLTGFESSHEENTRLQVYPVDITVRGFILRIESWGSTKLLNSGASWLAYPPAMPHITSDRIDFVKRGLHSNDKIAPYRYIDFPKGKFSRSPHVFAGISCIDLNKNFNARYEVAYRNVTKDGMSLSGFPWWDTDCYKSWVTYIAFDDEWYRGDEAVYIGSEG